MKKKSSKLLLALSLGFGLSVIPTQVMAAKPNILVIWGDDIGQSNISAYTRGMMGYKTPNIDRLADEGLMF
ncbi:MAG: arylsulfatase, partial [Campylobacterota bacterium]|nr:arylsulfatase [Campylobacterota bacterium]